MSEDPEEIRIFSRDEKKQYDIQFEFKDNKTSLHSDDVRNKSRISAMRE
jgi:FlaA1/EpsC-like NDP-sugar epimerase